MQRDRQRVPDRLGHRQAGTGGPAQIAAERMADVAHVLHRHRLVQPVVVADLSHGGGIALLAGEGTGRIARQRPDAEEHHDGHEHERDDRFEQPAHDVAAHDGIWIQAAKPAVPNRMMPSPYICTPTTLPVTPVRFLARYR